MANTTFNGPVRSENGFIDIAKDSLGNVITNMKLEQYTATVTVANGDTTGKESAIGMPNRRSIWPSRFESVSTAQPRTRGTARFASFARTRLATATTTRVCRSLRSTGQKKGNNNAQVFHRFPFSLGDEESGGVLGSDFISGDES